MNKSADFRQITTATTTERFEVHFSHGALRVWDTVSESYKIGGYTTERKARNAARSLNRRTPLRFTRTTV